MIDVARPGFLIAGALLALVPLVLHLLARRPGRPVPLPTLRFVEPSIRTALRLQRRPSDILLLVFRMLLLVAIGAAFSEPSWTPARHGTATVLLLDAAVPAAGIDSARRALDGTTGVLIVFDTAAATFTNTAIPAALDSLRENATATGSAPKRSSFATALAALAGVHALLPAADSARAVLVTVPRHGAWGRGVPAARATWPGGVELIEVPAPPLERRADVAASRTARVHGAGAVYVRAALEAVGYRVVAEPGPDVDVLFVLDAGTSAAAEGDFEAAGPDVTVVVAGSALPLVPSDQAPWRAAAATDPLPPTPIDIGGVLVAGAAARGAGDAAAGAHVIAHWLDGRPAVAARESERSCVVYSATPLGAGELPLDPAYPLLIQRVAAGCSRGTAAAPAGTDAQPLDAGALALLRGSGGAVALREATAAGSTGRPLARAALLVALLLAGVETWLAYRRTVPR